jgi:hypothetical protein
MTMAAARCQQCSSSAWQSTTFECCYIAVCDMQPYTRHQNNRTTKDNILNNRLSRFEAASFIRAATVCGTTRQPAHQHSSGCRVEHQTLSSTAAIIGCQYDTDSATEEVQPSCIHQSHHASTKVLQSYKALSEHHLKQHMQGVAVMQGAP